MNKLKFSEIEIYILLLIIVQAFLKSIISILTNSSHIGFNLITNKLLIKFFKIFSTFMNICFVIVAFYLLFIKEVRSFAYLVICFGLIIKGFMHFLVDNKLYKYLNLSKENEQKLIMYKGYESALTNLIISITTLYVLCKIFL
jgi:hypothetical protein